MLFTKFNHSMDVIGILKKHDSNLKCARDLGDLRSGLTVDTATLKQVVDYLRQGVAMFKFMSDVYDADGQSMGQLMYFTDGEWLWPSYYAAYLEKYPDIQVPGIFIDHVYKNQKVPDLSEEEIFYCHYMTDKLLTPESQQKGKKPPRKIQHLVEIKGEELICY